MLTIDGSRGEGGGQILRTSLALSLVTGKPFRIARIRAGRAKPGLMRQHLTAVRAAAELGRAEVVGAGIGSQELTFTPGPVVPGEYHFDVGSAGSTTLVLQTVLPALLTASGPSRLTLDGGTHNPFAPPFDFLQKAFLPLIKRMGPKVEASLERPGFYPAGGGRIAVTVEPSPRLAGFDLPERGPIGRRTARAIVSGLPRHIAERELGVVRRRLGWPPEQLHVEEVALPRGPGNVLVLEIESRHVTEVITAFGQRGVRAEDVARRAVADAERYLAAPAPVGEHLADQLILPLAMAGQGSFRTLTPTGHTTTNILAVQAFLDVGMELLQQGDEDWRLTVRAKAV